MKPTRTFILCFGIISLLLPNYLNAQYQIRASVLGGGGVTASNGNHRLSSTAGQIFIGSLQGGNFRKQVGFWHPAHVLTPVEEISELIPTEYRLDQNFPNPFNPSTTIQFALPMDSEVSLTIFDLLGREVSTLVHQRLPAGTYKVTFEAENLPSGIYFYRIQAQDFVKTRKLTLLK